MSVIVIKKQFPEKCEKCAFLDSTPHPTKNKMLYWCGIKKDQLLDISENYSLCPLKSVEGLIAKVRKLDTCQIKCVPDYSSEFVELEDVIEAIKEYCEVEE